MDYNAKLRESKLLIDKGMYTQAVFTLGNLLENFYTDFYQMVLDNATPAYRKSMTQREEEYAATKDRAAREKGFSGLTLGNKDGFFQQYKIIEEGERVLGHKFPRFKAFDMQLVREMRNEVAHGRDVVVDEDEANLFYSQVRVLLLEAGIIKKTETVPAKDVAASAGGLRSWKENNVVPHDDILHGNLEMDTYAADLWGVARDDPNTPAVYRTAKLFFEQTYLTKSLHSLLNDVLKVLGGGNGDRVLQLRTPFGGGKTHTLIALYHTVKNRNHLPHMGFTAIHDLPDVGECDVAAVQCEKFKVRQGRDTDEGIHINTLWGEIAYQIGGELGYELVRVDDEHYNAPGGESLAELLRLNGRPALILLDEVLNHVEAAQTVTVGESTLGRQLMIFLKNLTEAVSASRNAAMVYSLQASVREGLGAESLLTTLDHLVSRIDAKREPVSGSEIMRVVQRRLFKSLGDENAARQVASSYAEAFRRVRQAAGGLSADEQHQAAQEAENLAERILESYPFHPDLLDLMYHRWGTLSSYQRTRGALQFLASVVYDLWEKGRDLQPLIGAGDVPLDGDNARSAFFTQVGERENYTSVMDADLTGTNARAGRVDRRIAADSPALQRYRVGTRLATGAMLYSFGAREGEDRGVPETDLIQATTVPGLDRMSLTTALNDLRNELLYLHYTGRRYRFETQPNLNKLIDDAAKDCDPTDVQNRVKKAVEAALEGVKGAVVWPSDPGKINDHVPMLQIAYLNLEWVSVSDDEKLKQALTDWLEYCGPSRREYKNGVVFAIPAYTAADGMSSAAREVMAIESLERQQRRFNFNSEQMSELKARKNAALDRLTRGSLSLYDKVALPVAEETMYSWRFVELQSRSEATLHERVMAALNGSRLVFDSLTPDKLIALSGLTETQVIKTGDIVRGFFSFFQFIRLASIDAIANAIARGTAESKLGYTAVWQIDSDAQPTFPNPSLVYWGRSLRTDEIDLSDGVILDAKIARQATSVPTEPVPVDERPLIGASTDGDTPTGHEFPMPSPSTSGQKRRYQLSANADKARIFRVFRAVQNLVDRADRVTMQIEISAETDGEFDPVWIRNAVEEPLDEADVDARTQLM